MYSVVPCGSSVNKITLKLSKTKVSPEELKGELDVHM